MQGELHYKLPDPDSVIVVSGKNAGRIVHLPMSLLVFVCAPLPFTGYTLVLAGQNQKAPITVRTINRKPNCLSFQTPTSALLTGSVVVSLGVQPQRYVLAQGT